MFRSSISTSKTTPVLEAVPEIPLVSLEDGQLLALMDSWGRLGKVALRRFMAGLPEVARRGLYRRRGCSSVSEYAAKVAELSRDVVGQLMVLHSKIGKYRELWGLLAEGGVGWTKLARIADFVTPDNVLWWARIVQEAPRHVIERLVRDIKRLMATEGDAALAPVRLAACMAGSQAQPESRQSPGPQPAHPGNTEPVCQERGQASASHSCAGDLPGKSPSHSHAGDLSGQLPSEQAGSEADRDPSLAGSSALDFSQANALGASEQAAGGEVLPQQSGPHDPEARERAPAPGQANLFSLTSPVSAADRPSHDPAVGPEAGLPAAGPRRTWIELSPIGDALVGRMLSEYERRGVAVSLSELVEQGLRRLWADGDLDAVPGLAKEPAGERSEDPEHATAFQNAEANESVPDPDPDPETGEPVGVREKAGSSPSAETDRRVPIADHKILAVVVSVAETGETWMRTHGGVIPVRIADLGGLAPVVQVVKLGELAARFADRSETAKTMPVSGTLFVAAVSGGRCQRKGCNKPAARIHHLVAQADGGKHSPANTCWLCPACHDEKHAGLILNSEDHPADWVGIEPGQRPEPSVVDREYRRIKREALANGFRVA